METPRVTPHLCVDDVDAAVAFYRRVFGARTWLGLGIVLIQEDPGRGLLGPLALGGTAVTLGAEVRDVDGVLGRVRTAGGTSVPQMEGERYAGHAARFEDPFGHRWLVGCRRHVPSLGAGPPAMSVKGTAAPPSP